MNRQELAEFAHAIARSLDCMVTAYPDSPKLLLWTKELLDDAIECHELDNDQAAQLRSEVWQRLKPATREALQRLRQDQEAA